MLILTRRPAARSPRGVAFVVDPSDAKAHRLTRTYPHSVMAIGKNKALQKKGKAKKKVVDPFLRKEWYTIRAPAVFSARDAGKTMVTKTTGTRIASEMLKGRVFEASLADLSKNEDDAYRKIKLRCEDVEGDRVLTTFHGMDLTRDKLCSLIKKWQTLIEGRVDVRTADGYLLRMFCIAFTKRRQGQIKKTAYAQAAQVKQIRKKMVETMHAEASKSDLKELVQKFIPEIIGKEVEKACAGIFPLQNCYIRKVKVLATPKFDLQRLMESHVESEVGAAVDRADPAVEKTELVGSGGRL